MKHEQEEIRSPHSREAYKNGATKVRVFRELPETTLQPVERVERLRKTKQEIVRWKDGDKATTIEGRLEVLGKTKQERLRWVKSTTSRATESVGQNKVRFNIETETNVNTEQSDTRC